MALGEKRTEPVHATCLDSEELINRHTYTYGIWEGIGVCIGVPAKRGNSEHNGHSQKRAVNCYLWYDA